MAASDALLFDEVIPAAGTQRAAPPPSSADDQNDGTPEADLTRVQRKRLDLTHKQGKTPDEVEFEKTVSSAEHQALRDRAEQEWTGVLQGAGDLYFGGKQALSHAFGTDKQVKRADEDVMLREREYQQRTPDASGAGRLAGGIAVGAALGPGSTALGITGRSVAHSLMMPVTDTSEGADSYAKQKGTQVALGAGLSVAPHAVMQGSRFALRGGWKEAVGGDSVMGPQMAANIAGARRAGVERPTIGQTSAGGMTKGSGAAENIKDIQRGQLADRAGKELDTMHPTVRSQAQAGAEIEKGIAGVKSGGTVMEEGYMQRAKTTLTEAYDKAERALPPGTKTFLPETLDTLRALNKISPKAPATSAARINPKIQDFQARLIGDTGKSMSLPLEEVKAIRSWVGEMLDDPTQLAPGTSVSQLRKLYGALSKDMEAVAKRTSPKAFNLMRDANAKAAAHHDLLETYLQPILNRKIPEDIYNATLSNSKEGASRIDAVFKAIDAPQRDAVRAAYFNNELLAGGPAAFSKKWADMHPDVKDALFKRGSAQRTTIDRMADMGTMLAKKGTTIGEMRDFAMGHSEEGGLAALAYLTHHYGVVEVLLGGAGMGFLAGRSSMLSHPAVMRWLTRASTKSPATLISSLVQLSNMKKNLPPEVQAEVDDYIADIRALGEPPAAAEEGEEPQK